MGLKSYFQINRWRAFKILFLITLTQLATTVVTYLTSPQLNAIASGKFILFIALIGLQFAIGQICNVSFNLASVQNTRQTQQLFHRVRQRIIKHYYQSPTKVSQMENTLSNDLQLIQDNYYNLYFYFACDLIYVLLSIGTLFTFHWLLVAYSLLITALAVLIPRFLEKYTNQKTNDLSKANREFLQVIEKWIQGLDELRRFEKKILLQTKIGQQSQQVETSQYQHDQALIIATLVSSIFDILGRVGVPLIAGILFYQKQVSLGAILTAGYFANGIFYTVSQCVRNYTQLKSTNDLRQNLAKLQELPQKPTLTAIEQIAAIKVKNLSVKYKNQPLITYPDFEIKAGEKVLLTGDSGSGKSTLLKVLLGEQRTACGQVIYQNIHGQNIDPDLKQIGYLAQDLTMFPGTISQNITMFKPATQHDLAKLVAANAFESDLAKFKQGLNTPIDPQQNLLSGGQRQKVVLMRALWHQKKILFLDEATSAIDQAATTEILQNLVKSPATILMVAHNLTRDQRQLFDREIKLEDQK